MNLALKIVIGVIAATVTAFVAELVIVALLYLGHRRLSDA